jgi:hypothetical protein
VVVPVIPHRIAETERKYDPEELDRDDPDHNPDYNVEPADENVIDSLIATLK